MRKGEQSKKGRRKENNQGFSLLELLVSIVILVLIMVPLMNNFFNSMRVNYTAEELQDQSNLAANIMEGMKPMDMEATLAQFQDLLQFNMITFDDGTANAQSVIQLKSNGDGTYSRYDLTGDQNTYYFGINGITENNTLYDALITVDAQTYQYTDMEHGGTLMNNYPMPSIAQIDENQNGMLVFHMYLDKTTNALSINDMDDGAAMVDILDKIVLDQFYTLANRYADEQFILYSSVYASYLRALDQWQKDYQEALINGTALPSRPDTKTRYDDPEYANPVYCNKDNISDWITKTADIKIDDLTETVINVEGNPVTVSRTVLTYELIFQCDWPVGVHINDTINYAIANKQYSSFINNFYLYYDASVFQQNDSTASPVHSDKIHITNNSGRAINFYIVKQDNASIVIDPFVTLSRSGMDAMNTYTNMTDTKVIETAVAEDAETAVTEKITITKEEQRIYFLSVQICKHMEGAIENKYQEVLYKLESNRKE